MVQVMRRGENLTNDIEGTSNLDQDENQSTCSIRLSTPTQNPEEFDTSDMENKIEINVISEDTSSVKNVFNSSCMSNSMTTSNDQEPKEESRTDSAMIIKPNKQTNNQKDFNDFSESTSTLTINPDAALAEGFLSPVINYDVSYGLTYIICIEIRKRCKYIRRKLKAE